MSELTDLRRQAIDLGEALLELRYGIRGLLTRLGAQDDGDDLVGALASCLDDAEAREASAQEEHRALTMERDKLRVLLGAAARGELSRCETCGDRLATRHWTGASHKDCDKCFVENTIEALHDGEPLDEAAYADLPYAAALRAVAEVAP